MSALHRRYVQPDGPSAFRVPTSGAPQTDAAAGSTAGTPPVQGTAQPAPAVETGSLFSISIEQVVIGGTLLEGVIFGREFGRSGEFIILANVFELGDAEGTPVRFLESFEYRPAQGTSPPNQLRVVHYSADVRRHQPLNFSNIPLLTARRYNGRSVGIQIVILEVDVRSSALSSMLSTLADLGRGALPVPPGGQQLLRDLGQSLFTGRGDDTIFDYRFVLNPPGPEAGAIQPVLAPGRYVLRRSQDRATPINWGELSLDQNTARLYRRVNGQWVEARDELYLVLNIQQLPLNYPVEHVDSLTWAEAYDALQTSADNARAPANVLAANISTVVPSLMMRDELLGSWQRAEARLRILERLYAARDPLPEGCSLLPEEQRAPRSGLIEREAVEALDRFLRLYREFPYSGTGDAAQARFRSDDRAEVLRAVARYHLPVAENVTFATPEAFEAQYVQESSGQALITETIARAKGRQPAASDCGQLIRQGVARSS